MRLPSTLVVLFFILSPFTWSFLFITGPFLVRPIDIVSVLLILMTVFFGKIIISRKAIVPIALFLILLSWLLVNAIVMNELLAIETIGKVSLYLMSSVCVASWIVLLNYRVSGRLFMSAIVILSMWIIFTRPEIVEAFSKFSYNVISNPPRSFFNFWHDIFNINFFGPSKLLVKGVSFRNTMSLGFLTCALFAYGVAKPSVFSTTLFYLFLALAISSLSRTGILSALLFILIISLSIRSVKSGVAFFTVIVGVALYIFNSANVFLDTVGTRFTGGYQGRRSYIIESIEILNVNPLWGLGVDAKVSGLSGTDNLVHNVSIALGTQFGLLALFFSALIITFNFYAFIYFIKKWLFTDNPREKQLYTIFIVAAFIIVVRPNLSASAQNFYSYAEWGCFSLVLAGFSLSSFSKR